MHKVVHGLASGTEPMLTTTEAADFLGVSSPYLTRQHDQLDRVAAAAEDLGLR